MTARPEPDHPSLAPPAGTVTCLSVRCCALRPTPSPRTVPVMIEARELTKRYGDNTAVHSLSFTIAPGTVSCSAVA